MISWSQVEVFYGPDRAVGPIDLEVDDGEWLAVIGPNGAGKSTLLKAAVGLVEHTGSVRIAGGAPRPGLDVAWMPQRPLLPGPMGVSDYVMLGRTPHLGFLGAETSGDVASVSTSLARLDLDHLASRTLGSLSGGEAQRVVLARALAQQAPVLMLDEPTTGLDIGHAVEVFEVVDELRRAEGLTVVTAAHDLTLAARYADRLALISSGQLAAYGGAREVLDVNTLRAHYGDHVRVIDDRDGPVIVPVRTEDG